MQVNLPLTGEGGLRIHHQNDSTVAVQKGQNQLEHAGRSSSSQDISDQRRKS